ncbi:hypothetical protein FHW69_003743 [Luteibacter sp. Sphag1AF]|uniref:hypothetical protein n=1 Tax=Luteibacter sp. Sphag1AF TaxID=2587031 RepID=UPI00161A41BE|nr:hypothetical protein [Luteibacter sp. Sphag1AF]MBB3229094.1 hypothetical protein [Luteibacter sp. Sphag1AF]
MKQWKLQILLHKPATWARAALATCLALPIVAKPSPAPSAPLNAFMAKANDVFRGKGDAFEHYVELHGAYGKLAHDDRRQAGQVLSMIDAMFGRYQDATSHYAASFPVVGTQTACPTSSFRPKPAGSSIALAAGNARVLMINESHSNAVTRSSILAMLPSLKHAGFRYLALEALTPGDGPNSLHDDELSTRGYVRDTNDAGFYLQEPVYAELVRMAIAQGFELITYESNATGRDPREEEQANHLATWLRAHPKERLLVIGGYSHIWKADGWMAERLDSISDASSVSLDQVETLEHCGASTVSEVATNLWFDPNDRPWSAHPDRVDVTATVRGSGARGAPKTWLTLGGLREPVRLRKDWCSGHLPCLIEARRVGEPDSVPSDRWVRFAAKETDTLYLVPGPYVLTVRWVGGRVVVRGVVGTDGQFQESRDS